ncbi:MAG: DUF418 domain-containing protein [Thermoanaerobaculia bacterium]|nr:DUF418 domain-containing protein [Thermoanaerobaculia bacterium]
MIQEERPAAESLPEGESGGEPDGLTEHAAAAATAQPVVVAEIGPIAAAERVELIDIVRGLALFGILAANMRGFAGPASAYVDPSIFWGAMPDRIAQAVIDTFIQGKFVTIFACLFGVGFAVQLERGEARGVKIGRVYARRLGILAAFGIVHGLLIWFGDILLPYALIGFLLLLFRRRRDSTLIAWAVVGQMVPIVLLCLALLASRASTEPLKGPKTPTAAELASSVEIFANGSWGEIQERRTTEVVTTNWGMFPFYFLPLLGLFLAGSLAWRHRFFNPTPESLPRYRRWMWIGLAVGLTGNALATAIRWGSSARPFPPTPMTIVVQAILMVAVPMLSLGYVCGVVVLCTNPAWHRRLAPFGAVGRMALSNYLLQSVICTLIFYSYGLGLFGTIGPALMLIPTVAIYAVQPVWSTWWLRRFRFGPCEWIWRTLTYGHLQPMRLAQAPR